MDYAICLLSIAPVRAMDDDRSEQVTQLLFGELVQVLEKQDRWLFIQITDDNYQGWVSRGQLTMISEEDFNLIRQQSRWVSGDLVQVLHNKTRNLSFLVSGGSSFYGCDNNCFELLGESYEYFGEMIPFNTFSREAVVGNALMFQQAPYMWGGKSALGIDCSGLTQLAFRMSGKIIHRDASQQATQGELVDMIHEAQPGDLLFFDNEEGKIIHVGIMADRDYIIHAHQKVRIDKIDHNGIFNLDTRKYSHQLRVIKRI
jgi:gamma-D-glutamyl-L-lysine dipeptidyl-peptidase